MLHRVDPLAQFRTGRDIPSYVLFGPYVDTEMQMLPFPIGFGAETFAENSKLLSRLEDGVSRGPDAFKLQMSVHDRHILSLQSALLDCHATVPGGPFFQYEWSGANRPYCHIHVLFRGESFEVNAGVVPGEALRGHGRMTGRDPESEGLFCDTLQCPIQWKCQYAGGRSDGFIRYETRVGS